MFSAQGFKLSDELEAEIEALILQKGELPARTHGEIGRIYDGVQLMDAYLDHLASTVDGLQADQGRLRLRQRRSKRDGEKAVLALPAGQST